MLDKTRLIQVAQELGLEIELDSENPGVFFEESSILMPFSEFNMDSLDNIFAEEPSDKESYITKIVTSHYCEERTSHVYAKKSTNYSYGSSTKKTFKKDYKFENKNEGTYLKSSKNNQGVLAA